MNLVCLPLLRAEHAMEMPQERCNRNHVVWEENSKCGQSRYLGATPIVLVHAHRGPKPAHSLCSAEVAATFTSHCTLKGLWKSQKGRKNGHQDFTGVFWM